MQFNMQIKHFFCIYPFILGFFYLRRISVPALLFLFARPAARLPEYPENPGERAARSGSPCFSANFRQIHHFPPPATFFSFSPFHRLMSELRKKSVTLYFCNFRA